MPDPDRYFESMARYYERTGFGERSSRFLRNINILGAVALGGAAVLAPPVAAGALGVWAGVNAAQAVGFKGARRYFARR